MGRSGIVADDGSTVLLTQAQIAQLDAGCTQCTAPGVDQAMLSYLSTEPAATVLGAGDRRQLWIVQLQFPRAEQAQYEHRQD